MRKAKVLVSGNYAGILEEYSRKHYQFTYDEKYKGSPVSLTMPTSNKNYEYDKFPPFFEGLLPEGEMLEALLRKHKLDKKDYFGQLIKVGQDVVGAVTVEDIQ